MYRHSRNETEQDGSDDDDDGDEVDVGEYATGSPPTVEISVPLNHTISAIGHGSFHHQASTSSAAPTETISSG